MISSRIALLIAALATANGCVIAVDRDDHGPTPSPAYTTPTPVAPASPVVVLIDTDKTMNVTGGDGVGIFVEYKSEGVWQISWTCDTNRTGQSCNFTHSVQAAKIQDPLIEGQAFPGSDTSLTHQANTTTSIGKISFKSTPGASITVQSTVGGEANADGRYFFFVQNGNVNGGFNGRLSNPLTFQPR
jgi:hypothetical protein